MITIVNTGPHDDPNPMGVRNYEVRINDEVISTFRHERADGLAKCLRIAAESVESKKWWEVAELADKIYGPTRIHDFDLNEPEDVKQMCPGFGNPKE